MSRTLLLPALDPDRLEPRIGSTYPTQFTGPVANRKRRRLGDALGLSHYGVNLVELPPGAWSAHRHWHTHEDEFVYVVEIIHRPSTISFQGIFAPPYMYSRAFF